MYYTSSVLRRWGYYCMTIATIVGLMWLLLGPVRLDSNPKVALAASDPVIAAAGDIACDPAETGFHSGNGTATTCRQKFTANLLINAGLSKVLPLGDNQYFCGGYTAFQKSYDLSWGKVKSISRPVAGNHEYLTGGGTGCSSTANAAGYFKYFGAAAGSSTKGYYSYNVGAWHLIALNSNCGDVGGCGATSPQGKWLVADLAAHTTSCTLAYWHAPLFSSSGTLKSTSVRPLWQILYDRGADVILNGHSHFYERFAPQTPGGQADSTHGIREFVVGTGGATHTGIGTIAANSQVRNNTTYGVLELTLHSTSYSWKFVHESGGTFSDSGTGNCHGKPSTALPTPTASPTTTPTAGAASAAIAPTSVATQTPVPTATSRPSATPTASRTRTPTSTPTRTLTPTQTPTP